MEDTGCNLFQSCELLMSFRKQTHFRKTPKNEKFKISLNILPYHPSIKLKPFSTPHQTFKRNISPKINLINKYSKQYQYSSATNLNNPQSKESCLKPSRADVGKITAAESLKSSKKETPIFGKLTNQLLVPQNVPNVSFNKNNKFPIKNNNTRLKIEKSDNINDLNNRLNGQSNRQPKQMIQVHPPKEIIQKDKDVFLQQLKSVQYSQIDKLQISQTESMKFNLKHLHNYISSTQKVPEFKKLTLISSLTNNVRSVSSNEDEKRISSKHSQTIERSQVLTRFRRSQLLENNDNRQRIKLKINFSNQKSVSPQKWKSKQIQESNQRKIDAFIS